MAQELYAGEFLPFRRMDSLEGSLDLKGMSSVFWIYAKGVNCATLTSHDILQELLGQVLKRTCSFKNSFDKVCNGCFLWWCHEQPSW